MPRYDMIIIGSGPAGRRAAIQAAKLGRQFPVVEKGRRVGGVSVHTGTIPSKTLRETVLNLSAWRERGFYGRTYRVKTDISADDLRKRLHIMALSTGISSRTRSTSRRWRRPTRSQPSTPGTGCRPSRVRGRVTNTHTATVTQ